MSQPRMINPTVLSCQEEKAILGYFLAYALPPRVFLDIDKDAPIQASQCWLKDQPYVVSKDTKARLAELNITPPITITFTYTLLKARTSHTFEPIYHVLSGIQVGKGTFGDVQEILGRVKVGNDYLANYQPKARVAKFFFDYYQEYEERITHEYTFLRRIPNTGVKPPLQLTDNMVVLILRRVKGETIETLLKNHKQGKRLLTVDERLSISLTLAKHLKRLHMLQVLHRDVKPENFIYDLSSRQGELIDFGLCGDAVNKDHRNVGTPIYSPPERLAHRSQVLIKPLTEAADTFSFGCVLRLIWGADKNPAKNLTEALKLARDCKINNLFKGITDEELSPAHKAKISYCAHALTRVNPEERQTLNDFIYEMSTVQFERNIKTIPEPLNQTLLETFAIGVELQDRLNDITEAYVKKPVSKHYLDRLNHLFIEKFNKLSNEPQALKVILDLLHSHPFTSKDTKESILETLASFNSDIEILYFSLEKQKDEALNYQKNPTIIQNTMLLNTVKNIHLRNKSLLEVTLPLSLTEIAKHISRCKKYLLRNEMHLQCIDSRITQRSLTDGDMRNVITLFNALGAKKEEEKPATNSLRNV